MNTLLSSGFIEEVQQIAHYLKSRLAKLAAKYEFGQIRGEGLLLALDTGLINANRIIETAFSNGLILNAPNQSTIRFMPALNLTEQDIDIMIEKLDKAIAVAN